MATNRPLHAEYAFYMNFTDLLTGAPSDPTAVTVEVQSPAADTLYTYGVNGQLTKVTTGRYLFRLPLDITGQWAFKPRGTGACIASTEDMLVEVSQSVFS